MPIQRDPDYTGAPEGLDLNDPQLLGEVRALILTCPSYKRAVDQGMDAEELMANILLGMIVRQEGKSRYDRSRSSLGTYIRLVSRSIVSHSVDKARRKGWLVVGDQDDAALDAEFEVEVLDEQAEKPTVIGAYIRSQIGDIGHQDVSEVLAWRDVSRDHRILALVYRVAEGIWLAQHRDRVGSTEFGQWVREEYVGSIQSAYERIHVGWYVSRHGGTARDLARMADTPWRELRVMAREAFTAAHGTSRPKPQTLPAPEEPLEVPTAPLEGPDTPNREPDPSEDEESFLDLLGAQEENNTIEDLEEAIRAYRAARLPSHAVKLADLVVELYDRGEIQ